MRNAFSLLELVFVIVLIGVLSGVGFYMSRPDTTRQDAQYTLLKLKEARYLALGFEGLSPSHCVTLTNAWLSNNESPKHTIHSTITLNPSTIQTVCFDSLGRPHEGNSIALDTLMDGKLDILFEKSDKNSTVRLLPQTGYAIIPCSN